MADAPAVETNGLTSIIVLSRSRLDYTRRCLESLSVTRGGFEWIVVDNGSADGTREFLAAWQCDQDRRVKLILNNDDPGGCRARNQGVAEAQGEYLLFLDNDVYLEDADWLIELLAPLQESPRVVASSPLLLFPGRRDLVQCAGGGVTANGHFGLLWRGVPCGPEHLSTRSEAWAPTAALLVRRRALVAAGGFDGSFDPVSLCEDVDLCCRLRGQGEIVYVGGSRLRHYEGTTFDYLGYQKLAYWKRHARVIRHRWFDVLTGGPVHTDADISWQPIVKEYDDLDAATIRPATDLEAATTDLSFFASRATLDARPPDLRIGVVGCGQVAVRGSLPGFARPGSSLTADAAPFLAFDGAPGVRVVGVADIDRRRASDAARRFGIEQVESDAERLLDTVPMEGVAICTPPAWHVAYATAALRRGISVMVEKPGAVHPEDFQTLIRTRAAHPDLACLVNLPWAYHPAVEAVARLASGGLLGRVHTASALFEHGGPEVWAPDAAWYRHPEGGGVVRDLGLHVLVVLERLLGVLVDQLTGCAATSSPSGGRALATAVVGAATAALEVGWDAPAPRFQVRLQGSDAAAALDLIPWRTAVGPAAVRVTQVVPGRWSGPRLTVDDRGRMYLPVDPAPVAGGPYRQFVACVRSGSTGLSDVSNVSNAMHCMLDWAAMASS